MIRPVIKHTYSPKHQKKVWVVPAQQREAMGIDWMTVDELSQAIPPAYTQWIGERILETR